MLFGRPGMYTATTVGLRWQGLDRLGACSVRPGGFEHAWQIAQTAVELHQQLSGWSVLSEREIRSVEADGDGLLASVQVGRVGDRQLLHRPDLALTDPDGRVVTVEVELSIKSASRLAAICRGWARARHVERVYYLAAPGPARAVLRAARATKTTDRIRVLGLDDVPSLAADQCSDQEVAHVLGQ